MTKDKCLYEFKGVNMLNEKIYKSGCKDGCVIVNNDFKTLKVCLNCSLEIKMAVIS